MTRFEKATPVPLASALLTKAVPLIGPFTLWLNDTYQVSIHDAHEHIIHLSIKRIDKQPVHDWRDFQTIKNELVGPENEAVELYPAESRLVDTSNQYHLFVFRDKTFRLPFGFEERWVSEESTHNTVQRPWPDDRRPADLKSVELYMAEKGIY